MDSDTYRTGDIRPALDALAERIPSSEVINTGGGIWCLYIPMRYSDSDAYALVGEGLDDVDSYALGFYNSEEDEGTILKEWARTTPDDDATVVGVTLFTWTGGEW